MLSSAYFLAKFRFDTAENEPAKNLQNVANFSHALQTPGGEGKERAAYVGLRVEGVVVEGQQRRHGDGARRRAAGPARADAHGLRRRQHSDLRASGSKGPRRSRLASPNIFLSTNLTEINFTNVLR